MRTNYHHEADIRVRCISQMHEVVFEAAAKALTAVITDPESVASSDTVTVDSDAPDSELLLVDRLKALIFKIATRKMLFSRFNVEFDGSCLNATACGKPIVVASLQQKSRVQPIRNWNCVKTSRENGAPSASWMFKIRVRQGAGKRKASSSAARLCVAWPRRHPVPARV